MTLKWYWDGMGWYWVVLASMLHMYRATAAALNVLETLGFINDSRYVSAHTTWLKRVLEVGPLHAI